MPGEDKKPAESTDKLQARVKELEEENAKYKEKESLLSTLDAIGVNNISDLKALIQKDAPPAPKEEPKEEPPSDDDLKERVARLEEEKNKASQDKRLENLRNNVRETIEKNENLKILNRQKDNVNTLDAVINEMWMFKQKTGSYPKLEKVLEEKETALKEYLESNFEALGYKKSEEPETKEKGRSEESEKPGEEEPGEKKSEPEKKFKKLSDAQIRKLSKEEQINYFFELEESKEKSKAQKEEPKEEPKEEEKGEKEEKEEGEKAQKDKSKEEEEPKEPGNKTIKQTTGKTPTSEPEKDEEDMNPEERRIKKMKDAGFDI